MTESIICIIICLMSACIAMSFVLLISYFSHRQLIYLFIFCFTHWEFQTFEIKSQRHLAKNSDDVRGMVRKKKCVYTYLYRYTYSKDARRIALESSSIGRTSNRQIELNIRGIAGMKQVDASYTGHKRKKERLWKRTEGCRREGIYGWGSEEEGGRGAGRSVDAAWPLFGRRHFASPSPMVSPTYTPLVVALRHSLLLTCSHSFSSFTLRFSLRALYIYVYIYINILDYFAFFHLVFLAFHIFLASQTIHSIKNRNLICYLYIYIYIHKFYFFFS